MSRILPNVGGATYAALARVRRDRAARTPSINKFNDLENRQKPGTISVLKHPTVDPV